MLKNGVASYRILEDGTLIVVLPKEIFEESKRVMLEQMGTVYGKLYYMDAENE